MIPIIILAFNRLKEFQKLVESLQRNKESKYSPLFIFIDGPRKDYPNEKCVIDEIYNYAKTIRGFKEINIKRSQHNKGLPKSIISGVSEVIKKYGSVIVLEDDLYVSESFLRYMNDMLTYFKDDKRVFQVSGYSPKLRHIKFFNSQIYLNGRAQSWSWGTWIDRWNTIDWDISDFEAIRTNKRLQKSFNSHGSDMYGMLKGYMEGRIKSWYIRFCYAMHKQQKYCVCPIKSLVRNDGFGINATHCKNFNRYKIEFETHHEGEFVIPTEIIPNKKLIKEAIRYWSLPYRIYGKIRTIFMNL